MKANEIIKEETFLDWCNREIPYDREASRLAGLERCKELNQELNKRLKMNANEIIKESEGITEKDTEELQLQAKTNLIKCIKKENDKP